ncbi:ATP-grasp domain-containing protein [Fusibacter paucivorans]|uniref:ATP-grasp domain-containing protein n=1 Tax=Fusibacter paucivorans TaxID=76009 RepID=A0ABS5PQS5_9FIRM|nr:ATP-grasp domain-containing protein [Fusibacter paucivorans]MBS7526951.1 ATP-grasp domain-containing protein [Fusibacter paucivorans]
MREVVITDIQYRMTMTAIWSLGRKGIPITAVAFEKTKPYERLGFFSKYVTQQEIIPGPEQSKQAFINQLAAIGSRILERTGECPVLIVPRTQTHECIVQYSELIKPYFEYHLVCHENLERANNTFLLSEVAGDVNVPFPETTWLKENETIQSLANRLTYPVVVKYRFAERLTLKPEQRYRIIDNANDFVAAYSNMHAIQSSPLVQRYVTGSGFGVSCVFDASHEPTAIFCHKRLREYPVSGGPSTLCESIWDDRMVRYAVDLLKALNWRGFAMVEFKGEIGGDVYLMEINPRFWGSMMLSLQAGCDMPFAYYKSVQRLSTAHQGQISFGNRYQLGVRMQFILQDFLATVCNIRKRPMGLLSYFSHLLSPSTKDGLLSFSDPRPGIKYIMNAFLHRQ